MCGRYTLTTPEEELVELFHVPPLSFELHPRYNIAPTQDAPVVAEDSEGRKMGPLRWGLVPYWADDPGIGNRMINARSETVARKRAFRDAFRRRRCLVPTDGFYEWAEVEGEKRPYWIHRPDARPFAFAGLWERWSPPEGTPLYTFTILTTDAAPALEPIHPRMPVMLPRDAWDPWLSRDTGPEELQGILDSVGGGEMEIRRVSTLVNSPRNDSPECIEPVAEGSD